MTARSRRFLAAMLTVPLVAQCADSNWDPCYIQQVLETKVESVSIVSDTIQSGYRRTFQVQGLLWDTVGALLPEFLLDPESGAVGWTNPRKINWSAQPVSGRVVPGLVSIVPITPNGHRAMVKVAQPFGPVAVPAEYRIVARSNGFADTLVLRLVPRDSQLLTTGIESMSNQGDLASLAVIDGGVDEATDSCAWHDASLNFGRIGLLGSLTSVGDKCQGDFAIFSEGRRAVRGRRNSGPILLGFEPPEADTIGLVLWLPRQEFKGWYGFRQVVREFFSAVNEIRLAQEIFRRARSGLTFRTYGVNWFDPAILATVPFSGGSICKDVRSAFQAGSPSPMPDTIQEMHVIHAVYVREAGQAKMGLACTSAYGPMALAIVFMDTRVPSTLAHELGHHLISPYHFNDSGTGDPRLPEVPICDEPDEDNVVPEHNLMASWFGGHYGASRHHLTVGQVFWANFRNHSFINEARSYPLYPSPASFVQVRNQASISCPTPGATETCPDKRFDPGWQP